MAPERTCRGTKDDGSPCGAPSNLIDPETGLCPSHDPERREELREAGRKGAEATRRRFRDGGLQDEELPPLDGPRAAERWCEIAGRAVATGRLSHSEGKAVARLVREFLRSHDAGEMAERVERLEEKIAAAERGELEVIE